MQGTIIYGAFKYGFQDGLVQSDPTVAPEAAKIMRMVDETGLEVQIPFVGREQWEEFQRQVAAETAPSSIQIVPGGVVPKLNGHQH